MKKRIIASLAILAVFGLVIATYAYNQTANTKSAKASCCKKSDSCPMKAKMSHEKTSEHAGKSCPMKDRAEHEKSGDHAKTEGHSCDCCGDSCPMKKDGEAKATAASATDEGKNCCDNCDCCKDKTETSV